MRKLFFTIIVCCFYFLSGAQSCLPNGIVFTNQGQIDSFKRSYPTCKHAIGRVSVSGQAITNLDSLIKLESMGELVINNCNLLSDIDGLASLNKLKGALTITANPKILHLASLAKLDSVYTNVTIGQNKVLDVVQFKNLKYIGGNLIITQNDELKSVGDIKINSLKYLEFSYNSKLTFISAQTTLTSTDNFFLVGNPLLPLAPKFDKLSKVKGILSIDNNRIIESIGLYPKLKNVGSLWIKNNASLPTLYGLDTLRTVAQDFTVTNNAALSDLLGIDQLASVGADVVIEDNPSLTLLDGLSDLKTIGGNLWVQNNDILNDVAGLYNVDHIHKNLVIAHNASLVSLVGLDSLNTTTCDQVTIIDNPLLQVCNVDFVCGFIASCKPIIIYDNAPTCQDFNTVAKKCNLSKKQGVIAQTKCDLLTVNGISYNASGYYIQDSLGKQNPCDSSLLVIATILKSDYVSIELNGCDSLAYHGKIYTQSTIDTFYLKNINLCDSVVVTKINISLSKRDTMVVAACQSYFYNNTTYTKSGDYDVRFSSANFCDSIVTLKLTIIQSTNFNDTFFISSCTSYLFGDTLILNSGTYTQNYTSQSGCDSTVTLFLDILSKSYDTLRISVCENYLLNGLLYATSGTYTQTLKNNVGCDSILTLYLTIIGNNSYYSITDSECELYLFNGVVYRESGTYIDTFKNNMGCDSIVTLYLTINRAKRDTLDLKVCESVKINTTTYSQSGTYFQYLLTKKGCDSTLVIKVTIRPGQNSEKRIAAAACGQAEINGVVYEKSGTYLQTLVNAKGCDSTLTIDLVVKPSYKLIINETTCDSFVFDKKSYYNTGSYTVSYKTNLGCDSIYLLNLVINKPTFNTVKVSACESYTFNNRDFTKTGKYNVRLFNANGCDSVITLDLTILPGKNKLLVIERQSCQPISIGGLTIDTTGRYPFYFTTAGGCDSTVIIDFTRLSSVRDTIFISACTSFTINNKTYNASGVYEQYFSTQDGCDSILTIGLNIIPEVKSSIDSISCDPISINGKTYAASGKYTQLLKTSFGCDSILTINVSITNFDKSITKSGQSLVAQFFIGGSFYWIDCNTNLKVPNSNSSILKPPGSGSYAVVISDGECTDTSECFTFTATKELSQSMVSAYPNPVNNKLYIEVDPSLKINFYQVFDLLGRPLSTSFEVENQFVIIDMGGLLDGQYQIMVMTDQGRVVKRVVKQ